MFSEKNTDEEGGGTDKDGSHSWLLIVVDYSDNKLI